jgi:hypothetical protein
MMRALEVINATGQSILSFRKGKKQIGILRLSR